MVDTLEVYLIYKKSLEKFGLLVQMENLEHLGLVDTRKSDRILEGTQREVYLIYKKSLETYGF